MHWYGRSFDPLLLARPPFWRMTIWIDILLFGPFYRAAIYAFVARAPGSGCPPWCRPA